MAIKNATAATTTTTTAFAFAAGCVASLALVYFPGILKKSLAKHSSHCDHSSNVITTVVTTPQTTTTIATVSKKDKSRSSEREEKSAFHLRYLNEFLRRRCSVDLLRLNLFPDAKEVSESFGMWEAVFRHVKINEMKSLDGDAIIVVGDGMTPRTGVVCKFMSQGPWTCYSIDPIMRLDEGNQSDDPDDPSYSFGNVEGVRILRGMIENYRIRCGKAIIVMMHCHVTLSKVLESIDAESIEGVVCCPCCNWSESQRVFRGREADVIYEDTNIFTKKNEVRVWKGEEGEGDGSEKKMVVNNAPLRELEEKRFERTQAVLYGNKSTSPSWLNDASTWEDSVRIVRDERESRRCFFAIDGVVDEPIDKKVYASLSSEEGYAKFEKAKLRWSERRAKEPQAPDVLLSEDSEKFYFEGKVSELFQSFERQRSISAKKKVIRLKGKCLLFIDVNYEGKKLQLMFRRELLYTGESGQTANATNTDGYDMRHVAKAIIGAKLNDKIIITGESFSYGVNVMSLKIEPPSSSDMEIKKRFKKLKYGKTIYEVGVADGYDI